MAPVQRGLISMTRLLQELHSDDAAAEGHDAAAAAVDEEVDVVF